MMVDTQSICQEHPNYKDDPSQPPKTNDEVNFVEVQDSPKIFYSKEVLNIHLSLSQSKCQLNILIISSSKLA